MAAQCKARVIHLNILDFRVAFASTTAQLLAFPFNPLSSSSVVVKDLSGIVLMAE